MQVNLPSRGQSVSISYKNHHLITMVNSQILVLKEICMTVEAIYLQRIVGQVTLTTCHPSEFWHRKLISRSSKHNDSRKLLLKNVACKSSQDLFIRPLGHSSQIWRIKSQIVTARLMPWSKLRSRSKSPALTLRTQTIQIMAYLGNNSINLYSRAKIIKFWMSIKTNVVMKQNTYLVMKKIRSK